MAIQLSDTQVPSPEVHLRSLRDLLGDLESMICGKKVELRELQDTEKDLHRAIQRIESEK
jgi:hypothetical protein